MPLILALRRQRHAALCEFQPNLVYRACSRTASAFIQKNPNSKRKKKKNIVMRYKEGRRKPSALGPPPILSDLANTRPGTLPLNGSSFHSSTGQDLPFSRPLLPWSRSLRLVKIHVYPASLNNARQLKDQYSS